MLALTCASSLSLCSMTVLHLQWLSMYACMLARTVLHIQWLSTPYGSIWSNCPVSVYTPGMSLQYTCIETSIEQNCFGRNHCNWLSARSIIVLYFHWLYSHPMVACGLTLLYQFMLWECSDENRAKFVRAKTTVRTLSNCAVLSGLSSLAVMSYGSFLFWLSCNSLCFVTVLHLKYVIVLAVSTLAVTVLWHIMVWLSCGDCPLVVYGLVV